MCHTVECSRYLFAAGSEDITDQLFCYLDHILLVTEAHLDIDLRKLRLPVCPEIFITEALRNLEVAVEATHHQKLFEELRRLREGIEFTPMDTARYEIVPCTFGCGLGQDRCLYFEEAHLVE